MSDIEERVEVETVAHRTRVAIFFALFVFGVLSIVFWITATPRRWVPPLVALVLGVAFYFALK